MFLAVVLLAIPFALALCREAEASTTGRCEERAVERGWPYMITKSDGHTWCFIWLDSNGDGQYNENEAYLTFHLARSAPQPESSSGATTGATSGGESTPEDTTVPTPSPTPTPEPVTDGNCMVASAITDWKFIPCSEHKALWEASDERAEYLEKRELRKRQLEYQECLNTHGQRNAVCGSPP